MSRSGVRSRVRSRSGVRPRVRSRSGARSRVSDRPRVWGPSRWQMSGQRQKHSWVFQSWTERAG